MNEEQLNWAVKLINEMMKETNLSLDVSDGTQRFARGMSAGLELALQVITDARTL